MQFPLWKEESVPDLLCDEQDIELVASRDHEVLIDFDNDEERLSYQ